MYDEADITNAENKSKKKLLHDLTFADVHSAEQKYVEKIMGTSRLWQCWRDVPWGYIHIPIGNICIHA